MQKCKCKTPCFAIPRWSFSVEFGITRWTNTILVGFDMQVANTPTYSVLCWFPLFIALRDHNPSTLHDRQTDRRTSCSWRKRDMLIRHVALHSVVLRQPADMSDLTVTVLVSSAAYQGPYSVELIGILTVSGIACCTVSAAAASPTFTTFSF